jgi:dihydroxyacetone kinase-like protein
MLAATKAVDGGAGVVHIVKNYTGDVMNFKLAAEDAADEGIAVESVLVDDDVAVQDSLYTAGRRGVGATVLVEKIAGAAAERGDDVQAVAGLARRVNERARSFGVALSSCTPPAAGKPIFDLPDGEIELGIDAASRCAPPTRSCRSCSRPSSQTSRPAAGRRCCRSSTAWAGRP